MGCIFNAMLRLSCDIYTETATQDEYSGQFISVWALSETVGCAVTAVAAKGKSGAAIEMYKAGYKYDNFMYVDVPVRVTETSRITNILDISGVSLYQEPNGSPTVFEVVGATPNIDGAFGQVIGYRLLCNRSEVQEMNND